MTFAALIWKNLIRRPMRSLLTLLALTTAIAAVVGLLGVARGFTKSFADVYAAHAVDIVVSRHGSADRLSSSVDNDYVGRIEALPGVAGAAGVLLETLSLEDAGVYGIPSMGINRQSWLLDDYEIVDQIDSKGSVFDVIQATDQPPQILLLGIHLADRLGVRPGAMVSLFDEPYLVRGTFQSSSTWENGSMILPLETLQQLTDRVGQVTYINVRLNQPVQSETAANIIAAIEQLDSKLLPLATADFVETDTRMQIAAAMAWMTSMIALVIGTIGTLNTMLTSVMERTREIGILRAMGWPKRRVVRMILLESLCLAAVASLIGCLLAIGLTWGLSQAPAAKGILSPSIDASVLLRGVVLALGIGLLGAILPAWRAARMLPTEAFREH